MVDGLVFISFAIIFVLALISLMVILTVSVKALRSLRDSWFKSNFQRIEPALERFVLTGEDQVELLEMSLWRRDLFLSRLIVERMKLLRGAGRQYLLRLSEDLGLVDRFLKSLSSRKRWTRARAAENLGFFGGARCTGPLSRLLRDEDETIRAVAARALARLGTQDAVYALARTLDDESELTRLRVAENLERIGSPAIESLVKVLDDARNRQVGFQGPVQAVRVLGHLRAKEARHTLGYVALMGKNSDLRAQATLALGKVGDPSDIHKLVVSAEDREWPVRAQAANALGMIGESETVEKLQELMADGSWWVRMNASKALANMGPEGEKALVTVLRGSDHFARDRAAATLEERGVTRRMVRGLPAKGRKGKRAETIILAVVASGATKYLHALADTLPESEEREALRALLTEYGDWREASAPVVTEDVSEEVLEVVPEDEPPTKDELDARDIQIVGAEPMKDELDGATPNAMAEEAVNLLKLASEPEESPMTPEGDDSGPRRRVSRRKGRRRW